MPPSTSTNSLECYDTLVVDDKTYGYYAIAQAETVLGNLSHLPCSMRILLENLIRHENESTATIEDMRSVVAFQTLQKNTPLITFSPARLVLNDETGLSAMVDFAALREAMQARNNEPKLVDSTCQTTIIIDQPLPAQPTPDESERLALLKWAEKAFTSVHVVPPFKGRVNQINLDILTTIVRPLAQQAGEPDLLVPDSVLGTDRQNAIIGSTGTLGWSIDTLEAETIMLGNATSLMLPYVLGVKITGKPLEGTQITDCALELSYLLQQTGCAGRFVEFFGAGLDHLSVKDRAVLSRFAIEAGACATLFPVDKQTLDHLAETGTAPHQIAVVEAYSKIQGLWREAGDYEGQQHLSFSAQTEFSLDTARPVLRPTHAIQPIQLEEAKTFFEKRFPKGAEKKDPLAVIKHGDVVWADIGTHDGVLHPAELVTAGLIARKALAHGLKVKPWVRAFLAGTSEAGSTFLHQTGLLDDLKAIGFLHQNSENQASGSQSIQSQIEEAILSKNVAVCSLVTTPPLTEAYPASLCRISYVLAPALIVAFALAGTFLIDLTSQALVSSKGGRTLTLKDLWPTVAEINALWENMPLTPIYQAYRAQLYQGPPMWERITPPNKSLYPWRESSTFVRHPPYLQNASLLPIKLKNIFESRIIAIYGDNVPASAIAPEGLIPIDGLAASYLASLDKPSDRLGSFSYRTGNHEVMARGAFGGKALVNALLPPQSRTETGMTFHAPSQTILPFFQASERYTLGNTPTLLAAGKNFGSGGRQEWAAKALRLQNIYAVLAESFDPSFRLNLIRVGVLPLQLKSGLALEALNLDGQEFINLAGLSDIERPPSQIMMTIEHLDSVERYMLFCRLDTPEELAMYRYGSMWAMALRTLISLADQPKT